jgi:hypothetical protein
MQLSLFNNTNPMFWDLSAVSSFAKSVKNYENDYA